MGRLFFSVLIVVAILVIGAILWMALFAPVGTPLSQDMATFASRYDYGGYPDRGWWTYNPRLVREYGRYGLPLYLAGPYAKYAWWRHYPYYTYGTYTPYNMW